jgi:hypothetical protein
MSFKKTLRLGAVASAALLALPAFAARSSDPYDPYAQHNEKRSVTHDLGVAVTGGLNFYSGDLGRDTGTGGSLGILADARPLSLLGFELGYEGSRNPFVNIGGSLWSNTGYALAKVGPELGMHGNLRPFLGAGFGMGSLNPTGDADRIFSTDFITEVPLVAGVDYKFGHSGVRAGARANYRILGGESIGAGQNGNEYNFALNVGGSF